MAVRTSSSSAQLAHTAPHTHAATPHSFASSSGATVFLEGGRKEVRPEAGMVLIFQHNILHEGQRLASGKKYIMRSDVMYRR